MIIKDSIVINAPPEKIYNYLIQHIIDQKSYKEWHKEHISLKWLKGKPSTKGSIVYIEEYLGDNLQKMTFKFTKFIPNKLIKYRILYPLALFAPGNEFIIEKLDDKSSTFTARGKINISEKMFLKMHPYHKQKLMFTKRHMKEEGENIKKALEENQ